MNVDLDSKEYGCEFHHVQIYSDSLKPMSFYKNVEKSLNKLASKGSFDPFTGGMKFLQPNALRERVLEGRKVWDGLCPTFGIESREESSFTPAKQDIVEQMVVGLGWRVTAEYIGSSTRSVLVSSRDPKGVKLVVTTALSTEANGNGIHDTKEAYDHFDVKHWQRYRDCHHGVQGIAVLGFELPDQGSIETVEARYKKLHPGMFIGVRKYEDNRIITDNEAGVSSTIVCGSMIVLEAYAYYKIDKHDGEVDKGTVLRFVHRTGSFGSKEGFGNPQGVLPGLEDVPATFDGTSIPAYADHWVSNVVDRNSFLDTLKDVLGFTPKVDFNAGVVAAGQAKIESTVTGNNSTNSQKLCESEEVLRDQSQIYLPINNALSEVGHVHGFLREIGQGVQHLASRVKDLVRFIERVNNYRIMTGRGFSFLRIPRSYYGRLVAADFEKIGLSADDSNKLFHAIVEAKLCSLNGIVELDVSPDAVIDVVKSTGLVADFDKVVDTVKRARFSNMYSLLRDHFNEETYLQIVRNQILVDIQGNDILFQIFTCNILLREVGEESPFLEFIQRVCSQKKRADGTCAPIKPGCGGFGIRNFLTLFLSIEVTKAMDDVEKAIRSGDKESEAKGRARVELFTNQLEESNPILTDISDAMTAEGDALDEIASLRKLKVVDEQKIAQLESIVTVNAALKLEGNKKLQALSERYSQLMEQYK